MMINFILLFLYTMISCTYLFYLRKISRSNPVFYYLIIQWIIAAGTILLMDFDYYSDVVYAAIYFISLIMFIVGSMLAIHYFNINRKYISFYNSSLQTDRPLEIKFVVVFLLISIVVVTFYYIAIGYNLTSSMLFGYGELDFKTLRIATYSGDVYYAPGYVNQFKNILLPSSLLILLTTLFIQNRKIIFYILLIVSIPYLVYILMGTGQRAPIVYVFLSFFFAFNIMYRLKIKWLFVFFSVIVLGFAFVSFNSGRTEGVFNALTSIFTRVFYIEQYESLLGFRYVFENLEFSWFNQWLEALLGVLPNHQGSRLDHILYANIHGTDRGTSGLTLAASVYYNGSIISSIALYFLLGFAYIGVFSKLLSGRKTLIRSVGYGGIIFILSVFVVGTPVYLLNKGILAFLLFLFIGKVVWLLRINGMSSVNAKGVSKNV